MGEQGERREEDRFGKQLTEKLTAVGKSYWPQQRTHTLILRLQVHLKINIGIIFILDL